MFSFAWMFRTTSLKMFTFSGGNVDAPRHRRRTDSSERVDEEIKSDVRSALFRQERILPPARRRPPSRSTPY
jgi:hypothetical protein